RGGKKLVEGAFFWGKCPFQPAAPLQPAEGPTEGHFALYAGKCAGQDSQSFSSTLFPGAAGSWISPAGTGSLRHMAWFRGVPLRGCAVGCDVERVLASAAGAGGWIGVCDGQADLSSRPCGCRLQPHRDGGERPAARGAG